MVSRFFGRRENGHAVRFNDGWICISPQWGHALILLLPLFSLFFMAAYISYTGGPQVSERIAKFGEHIESPLGNSASADYCGRLNSQPGPQYNEWSFPNIKALVGNHISWQVTTVIFCFTCLAASFISIRIWLNFINHWLERLLSIFLVVVFLAGFVVVLSTCGIAEKAVTAAILESLFKVGETAVSCIGAAKTSELIRAIYLTALLEALTFHALFLAAFALIFSQSDPNATPTSKAADLSLRAGQLRILLFVGSTILFIGVASSETLFAWRAGLLPDDLQKSAVELGKALSLIWVAKWTMSLAILFCWPQAVLNRRAENIYRSSEVIANDTTRKKWLEENGLEVGIGEWFVKILAILGPLLATSGIPTTGLLP